MNTIKKLFAISALAISAALPVAAFAQTTPSMTDGEVRKIDQEAGKVTIKHGEIKHLDMPGMTMVFTAKDKAILVNVKTGDKVKFMVISDAGKMVVTEIQPTQ